MTLASSDYIAKYHPTARIIQKDSSHPRIVGVVEGHSMTASSGAELTLHLVTSTQSLLEVKVFAHIIDRFPLGLLIGVDTIFNYRMALEPARGRFSVQNGAITGPLQSVVPVAEPVFARKDVLVGAGKEKLVPIGALSQDHQELLFLGMPFEVPSLGVAARCVDELLSPQSPAILVTNSGSAPLRLSKGTLLGHVEPLSEFICAPLELGRPELNVSLETEFDQSVDDGCVESIDVNPALPTQDRELLMEMLRRRKRLFRAEWGLLNDGTEMEIVLKEGVKPVASVPYRNSPAAKRVVDETLGELQAMDRIEPSTSPWASPVFVVRSHGKDRMVIDLRKVNECVEPDSYPLPRQDDILQAVAGARFISVFDLKKGFYQMPIAKKSRPITAICSHRGLEQLKVSVMGFRNSPAYFQRKMDAILAPWLWKCALAYIDDLVVWSSTLDDHVRDVDCVLGALEDRGLSLNASKAHVGYDNIPLLGHKVGRLGLSTREEKIKAMMDMREPTTYGELEVAIGALNYYSNFVPNFSLNWPSRC
jgi:hypothetical protein